MRHFADPLFWECLNRLPEDIRALAYERSEGLQWFWIGPHHEYDKFL